MFRSPNKIQEMGADKILFPAPVLRMDIGTGPSGVVGGFAPAGLNVNNNNYDNDNIGVGGLRKFC